jgi:hypothetical protein
MALTFLVQELIYNVRDKTRFIGINSDKIALILNFIHIIFTLRDTEVVLCIV